MIRYVEHRHINKKRWDESLERSINMYIYGYSWYLDILTDYQWDALIVDDYRIVMPLPYAKKWGFRYIHQPVFTQQLGAFGSNTVSSFELMELMKAIPEKFKLVDLNFNKFLYRKTPQHLVSRSNSNYELELSASYAMLRKGYSTNHKRNLKKAEKSGLKEISFVKPEEVIALFRNNKGKELRGIDERHYQRLQKLIYMLIQKGKVAVPGVINQHNQVIAGAFFLRDKHRITFLFSGLDAEGLQSGAMPFLIDQQIRKHAESHLTLDFEGSNKASLARFYAGFGSTRFSYESILINRLPFPASLAYSLYRRWKLRR